MRARERAGERAGERGRTREKVCECVCVCVCVCVCSQRSIRPLILTRAASESEPRRHAGAAGSDASELMRVRGVSGTRRGLRAWPLGYGLHAAAEAHPRQHVRYVACLRHVPVFGITPNILVRSSQSSSGPAGGASDGYGLGRGAAGPDRRCTTTAAGALRVIV